MERSPEEICAAQARLVREIRTHLNAQGRTRTSEDALARSVLELTQIMRGANAPPESVVVAVKTAFYDAGMGPGLVQWDKTATQPTIAKLVSWCVDAYYAHDSGHLFSLDTPAKSQRPGNMVPDAS